LYELIQILISNLKLIVYYFFLDIYFSLKMLIIRVLDYISNFQVITYQYQYIMEDIDCYSSIKYSDFFISLNLSFYILTLFVMLDIFIYIGLSILVNFKIISLHYFNFFYYLSLLLIFLILLNFNLIVNNQYLIFYLSATYFFFIINIILFLILYYYK